MTAAKQTIQKRHRRQRLRDRDGDYCWFECGKKLDFNEENHASNNYASIEHLIVNRRDGGTNHLPNLALSCKKCNSNTNALTYPEKLIRREHNLAKRVAKVNGSPYKAYNLILYPATVMTIWQRELRSYKN